MQGEQNSAHLIDLHSCPHLYEERPTTPKELPTYLHTVCLYGILTQLILKRIINVIAPGLLNIQHGVVTTSNTTTFTAKLGNDVHKTGSYLALRSNQSPVP